MGMRINNIVIGGTVGRDPEMRATGNGKSIASFSIAVDSGKDKEADWFDVTAWEQQAELVSKYVTKGSNVVVIGRISQDKWEDKNGGGKRSKVVIIANNVQLVGGKRKEEGGGGNTAVMPDEELPF
jgi:single-strand DNA-binding protein